VPHSEQVVRVSGRTLKLPRARLALHCLQCLGSFLNCLSWKNNCSPAVNTKSAPQSVHFKIRSLKSMAGFPVTGSNSQYGHALSREECWSGGSLFSFSIHNKGPDRGQKPAALQSSPGFDGEGKTKKQSGNSAISHKHQVAKCRRYLVFYLAGGRHRYDAMAAGVGVNAKFVLNLALCELSYDSACALKPLLHVSFRRASGSRSDA